MTPPRTLPPELLDKLRKAHDAYGRIDQPDPFPPNGSLAAAANTLASRVRDLLAAIDAPHGPTL